MCERASEQECVKERESARAGCPQVHHSNERQFRGGLVFKARKLVVSLSSRPRVIKKKEKHHWSAPLGTDASI